MNSALSSSAGTESDHEATPHTNPRLPSASSEDWPEPTPSEDETADGCDESEEKTAEELYDDAVAEGRELFSLIGTSPPGFDFPTNALSTSGYTTDYYPLAQSHYFHQVLGEFIDEPIHDLKKVDTMHSRIPTSMGLNPLPATDAEFKNAISISAGVIIAASNIGPEHSVKKLKPGQSHPDLKHWSDVVALQTLDILVTSSLTQLSQPPTVTDENAPFGNLKYVLRHDIQNPTTNEVVHYILQEGKTEEDVCDNDVDTAGCPDCMKDLSWPGLTFHIGRSRAMALLGTPNGEGVAWLLAEHQDLFGQKTISKITVWCDSAQATLRPNLLFHISDMDVMEFE